MLLFYEKHQLQQSFQTLKASLTVQMKRVLAFESAGEPAKQRPPRGDGICCSGSPTCENAFKLT